MISSMLYTCIRTPCTCYVVAKSSHASAGGGWGNCCCQPLDTNSEGFAAYSNSALTGSSTAGTGDSRVYHATLDSVIDMFVVDGQTVGREAQSDSLLLASCAGSPVCTSQHLQPCIMALLNTG